MVNGEFETVKIKDDFYRDSLGRVFICFIGVGIGIALLLAVSLYLHFTKPEPTTFFVEKEWRVQGAVPLTLPYLSTPDMLQWVAEFLPRSFVFDFINYNDQLQNAKQFFTTNGWTVFSNQLNNYVSYDYVTTNKLFVTARPLGAPFILNQGVLSGRYAWWVQMPLTINFASAGTPTRRNLTLQILVVRTSTLNNLNGIAIDNVIVSNSSSISTVSTAGGSV